VALWHPKAGTSVASACDVVRRYQDLECWQLADELKKEVYALVARTPAKNDWKFRDQILDSAASAPRNLAEAFGYYEHPDSARFARVAKSSELETHNHLGDGVDRGFWTAAEAERIQRLASRTVGATTKWLLYLTSTDAPGGKSRRHSTDRNRKR
jgi:four helix bundle protein